MFIFMFLALVVGSLYVEDNIVQAISSNLGGIRFTKDRLTFAEWHATSNAPNLIFSLGLSLILSLMFPAAGLVVLTAGLVSTALSKPWARMRASGRNATTWYRDHKSEIRQAWNRNKAPLVDLVHAVMAFIRLITWPWRKYEAGKAYINNKHTQYRSWRAS